MSTPMDGSAERQAHDETPPTIGQDTGHPRDDGNHVRDDGKHVRDSGKQPGVEEIERDIARTRQELAATVDALTDRLDVKSRVRGKVDQTKQDAVQRVHLARDRAIDTNGRPTPPVIAGAVAVVVLVALLVWQKARR